MNMYLFYVIKGIKMPTPQNVQEKDYKKTGNTTKRKSPSKKPMATKKVANKTAMETAKAVGKKVASKALARTTPIATAFMAGYEGAKALGADRLGKVIGNNLHEYKKVLKDPTYKPNFQSWSVFDEDKKALSTDEAQPKHL